ncbi:MAG: sulfide/dihydroorotate dehydrogenase-like FAD/NAD-binding protein [Schwartzia sp.]|nr:sulfide/dihydroorotate dehydrogenase-like FAD/NAD-binding protein [Schwartzia sp. (in: firmicutes)]
MKAKVLKKELLSSGLYRFDVEASRIAKKTQPGQFIILRVNEQGERIPLTVADFDREKGTITIIFREVGASTELLAKLEPGEEILDFVGPLGQKSEIEPGIGTVVCIGGGVGIAPVYPIARGMKEAGNKVISILGARSKDILIMEEEMRAISDEIFITTDDGSYGVKGFVTTALQQIVDRGEKIDRIYAIGPVVMMKSVVDATRPLGIKTIVSLNPVMVDGTGMCGCCRVEVGGETKFACVDGPEFDGHQVDFDGLRARQAMYREMEAKEMDHVCRIGLGRDE